MTERSSSAVHVRAHDRESGRVKVDAHERGRGPRRIGGVVGNGRANALEDVREVRGMLAAVGWLPAGEELGPYLDRPTDTAIRGYQTARGLRSDGLIAPDGPTLASLEEDLASLRAYEGIDRIVDALEFLRANPDTINTVIWEQLKAGITDPMGFPILPIPGSPLKIPMGPKSLDAHGAAFRDLAEKDLADGKGRGFDLAADLLGHYRAGSGRDRVLSRAEVQREPVLMKAEAGNRVRFEVKTFVGLNEDDRKQALTALPDGERLRFVDHWETPANWSEHRDRLGSYLALGQTGIRSDGSFEAVRRGNTITIKGNVVHRLDSRLDVENNRGLIGDRYDFNRSAIGSVDALLAENLGSARPFEMTSAFTQGVEATVEVVNGGLKLRKVDWKNPP